jgi:hypothetical protein
MTRRRGVSFLRGVSTRQPNVLAEGCYSIIWPFLHFGWTEPRPLRCGSPASVGFRLLKYKLGGLLKMVGTLDA